MLLCQDENRNHSRKSNAAKKEKGENVKLGRRRILEGIWCLAFLINRCSQDITLSLFGTINSGDISIYPTSTSQSTICSFQFLCHCASCAPPSPPSIAGYSPQFSTTYSNLYFKAVWTLQIYRRQTYAKAVCHSSWISVCPTAAETPAWPWDLCHDSELQYSNWGRTRRTRTTKEGIEEVIEEDGDE